MLYFLFFCSGLSGLIYQVVWVRVFGNVFGNTIYSASLIVAVFMLGLGTGSYVVGAWADRRYASRPESLLRAYGYFELIVALMGLGLSMLLPHLDQVSALVSSYTREPSGWYAPSATSSVARAAIAVVLLTPITLLMGGTLTLLIRHLVRRDLESSGWRVAVLYAVNTTGAAVGCFITDFTLVPAVGLRGTQVFAVLLNVVAGVGALFLAMKVRLKLDTTGEKERSRRSRSAEASRSSAFTPSVAFACVALAMTGFAAMGMEILWFRHFTILLGQLRAVFSLLLAVILIGIGAGSLLSGFVSRRTLHPAQWLMVVQALFVGSTLLGIATADARGIEAIVMADPGYLAATGRAGGAALSADSGFARTLTELWFNARPILWEVGLPALLMGFSFPLANAIIQHAEQSVGRRAGVLYLANTCGAVAGALATGFLLLPAIGIQRSATILMLVAALTVVPLFCAGRGRLQLAARLKARAPRDTAADGARGFSRASGDSWTVAASLVVAGGALGFWLLLPADHVNVRALRPTENERVLAVSEGLGEIIAVTEIPGQGRRLLTNGHPMSSTTPLAQRYMRALAHVPLLCIDKPETVLVIGFGVGNTTHAATLHPTIRRVEVADLSREILGHSRFFTDVNGDVLKDPRVAVYINDGRHHLQMQPPAVYDLITLEPPPVGYAGVAALYSREFYELARTRLKPQGYVSQWLPAYQVPTATALAMIRAFLDVFPQAVLLSGAEADLLLVGVNGPRIEIDPIRVTAALSSAPAAHADLRRLDLGGVREIAGMFVGSPQTLAAATRDSAAVSDDRPIQEYGAISLLNFGDAVPASVVDLNQIAAWCPACFVDGKPVAPAHGLDTYLALLGRAYTASQADVGRARNQAVRQNRIIAGSAYLGAVVPESADLHNALGIALAEQGQLDEAIAEFREALRIEPEWARTHWHLGAALASGGARDEAIEHLRRSVQLDPKNADAQHDLSVVLASPRRQKVVKEVIR